MKKPLKTVYPPAALVLTAVAFPSMGQPPSGQPQVFDFDTAGPSNDSSDESVPGQSSDPANALSDEAKVLYEQMMSDAKSRQGDRHAQGLPEPGQVAEQARRQARSNTPRSSRPDFSYSQADDRRPGAYDTERENADLRRQIRDLQERMASQNTSRRGVSERTITRLTDAVATLREDLAAAKSERNELSNRINQNENSRVSYDNQLREVVASSSNQISTQQQLLAQLTSQISALSSTNGDDWKQAFANVKETVSEIQSKQAELLASNKDIRQSQNALTARADRLASTNEDLKVGLANMNALAQIRSDKVEQRLANVQDTVHQTYALTVSDRGQQSPLSFQNQESLDLERLAGVYQAQPDDSNRLIGDYLTQGLASRTNFEPLAGGLSQVPFGS